MKPRMSFLSMLRCNKALDIYSSCAIYTLDVLMNNKVRYIHDLKKTKFDFGKRRRFKAINKALSTGKKQITSILKANGDITTDRDRIVERAPEFYQELYSSKHG